MNNYWTRLRDVITFLFIWFCLPLYFSYKGTDNFIGAIVTTILIMWIPALYITMYLSRDE